MSSLNCWEAKKCERQPGGSKVTELGICPVTTTSKVNGVNSGKNGGRVCWAIAGTLCGGKVQGTFSQKMMNCMNCDFYKHVFNEEKTSGHYMPTADILKKLAS